MRIGRFFLTIALLSGICNAQSTTIEEWSQTFGGAGFDYASSVHQTTDGGFILAGRTESFGAGGNDAWLIKTNASGTEEWSQTFGGGEDDIASSVHQTTDGGFIIAGSTGSFGAGYFNGWLIKTDASGSEEWSQIFGGVVWDTAYSVQQTADGGFIIAGSTTSYGSGSSDAWLIRTDENGTEEWSETFGGVETDYASSVHQTTDGGFILAGRTESFGAGGRDAWLIKTNASGTEEWSKTFGGVETDHASSVQPTADGGFIIAGWTASFGAGSNDAWLIRIGGGLTTSAIKFYNGVTPSTLNALNLINPGRPVRFKIEVKNNLTSNILTGYGTIETETEGVTITDDQATFNNILAGSRAWTLDEFEIIIDDSFPSGAEIEFSLRVEQQLEPRGPWISSISFPIKPLEVNFTLLDDDSNPDSNGDNDGIIEPGETIELIPLIENVSNNIILEVWGTLHSGHDSVIVWDCEMGASDSVFNTYRYNVLGGLQQPIYPFDNQVQPEVDYVFFYSGSQIRQIPMGLILTAKIDSTLMRWDSAFLLNVEQAVANASSTIPNSLYFGQNYPNPFNPTTTISYSLPEQSTVSLTVYDLKGQEIVTLQNGAKPSGTYEVQWNGIDQTGNPVSTGVYFCRLAAGSYSKTIKMVYLR